MKYTVNIGEKEFEVEIKNRTQDPKTLDITLGGRTFPVEVEKWQDQFSLMSEGKSILFSALVDKQANHYSMNLEGRRYPVKVVDEYGEEEEVGGPVDGIYREVSPMPGLVKEIKVIAQEKVEVGQVLLIMEAMKMEMEIKAKYPGTVVEVPAPVGASVQEGDELVRIEVTE